MFYFENTRKPDFKNFNKINYNKYWEERGFELNNKLKEREIIMLDIIHKGSKVIDIGCGNSLLPVKLSNKGCEVSVVDISDVVLKGYEKHNLKTINLDLESQDEFNIGDNYDYIIMSEVLEHTSIPEEIIQKLKGKSKKILITIPNSAFYRYRVHLFFYGRFFTQWHYHPSEHLRYWSHLDFLDWLDAMGLNLDRSISSNGFSLFGLMPGLKNLWKNMFGHQIIYICNNK